MDFFDLQPAAADDAAPVKIDRNDDDVDVQQPTSSDAVTWEDRDSFEIPRHWIWFR